MVAQGDQDKGGAIDREKQEDKVAKGGFESRVGRDRL
jgi:hypothetical protein